jgi:rubrerythrin
MATLFKANDAALAALEIETRGEKFYLGLAEKAEDARTRKLFEYLAGEETKHKATFQALYDRLGDVSLPGGANQAEFSTYMNALIDTHTLFRESDTALMENVKNRKDAIMKAMVFEKESILFFMEMREMVPEREKKFIDECIDEERAHLRQLNEML